MKIETEETPEPDLCKSCNGSGIHSTGDPSLSCYNCKGTGSYPVTYISISVYEWDNLPISDLVNPPYVVVGIPGDPAPRLWTGEKWQLLELKIQDLIHE